MQNYQACKELDRPQSYKTLFMLNSTEHEIYPAHVKMPTVVGILTFISMIHTSEGLKARKVYISAS